MRGLILNYLKMEKKLNTGKKKKKFLRGSSRILFGKTITQEANRNEQILPVSLNTFSK